MSASLHASLNPPPSPLLPLHPYVPSVKPVEQKLASLPVLTPFEDDDLFIVDQVTTTRDSTEKDNSRTSRSDPPSVVSPLCNPMAISPTDEKAVPMKTTSRIVSLNDNVGLHGYNAATCVAQEETPKFKSPHKRKKSSSHMKPKRNEYPTKFDYHSIVPECLKKDTNHNPVRSDASIHPTSIGDYQKLVTDDQLSTYASIPPAYSTDLPSKYSSRLLKCGDLIAANSSRSDHVSKSSREPPFCPPSKTPRTTLPNVIWGEGVLDYLSSAEVRGLRLVCKSIAEDLEQYVFRNLVTKFNPSMFNLGTNISQPPTLDLNASDSMLRKYGSDINKFGIAFEIDLNGLSTAPFKTTETTINAWFGRYRWPVKEYPYFASLRQIDQILDDDRRFLTQALGKLPNCSELALSLDSGHGWLEGPDISDLALYRQQTGMKSPVFGKTFSAPDKRYEDGLKQLFTWAQLNTIDENIKHLALSDKPPHDEIARLRAILIRNYDSYHIQTQQPDYERHLHTGGVVADNILNNTPQARAPNAPNINSQPYAEFLHGLIRDQVDPQTIARRIEQYNRIHRSPNASETSSKAPGISPIHPQWPIIFSGFNLASECRGDSAVVQNRVACPSLFPLLPGQITEAQAQWMMETAWIQRTFLTAYTDAVRLNAFTLRTVHTLTIAQLSSGLLPSLSQEAFWTALPGLRKVKVLLKPDWRVEHTPGDKLYQSNMLIHLAKAARKFTEFLRNCIAKLENLYTLHVGYFGGGEHQVGMFGRNQHVLPAPVTHNAHDWLLAYNGSASIPNSDSILVFHHVRNLTFENCWFSPRMLETFMTMSRDTSLHYLTLESVSLTARINSTRTDGPLQTVRNNLKCTYGPGGWLNEEVPDNASWVHVLDKITPGQTILDRKYSAKMIDEEVAPKPDVEFRGNIQQISLKSCGYVKIRGVSSTDFNQNELVVQNSSWSTIDEGLRTRASSSFSKTVVVDTPADENDNRPPRPGNRPNVHPTQQLLGPRNSTWTSWTNRLDNAETSREPTSQRSSLRFVMLGGRPGFQIDAISSFATEGSPHHTNLTGVLTQCVHPIEKRVLEQCWGMQFGWKNDMRRWESVEDGWFIGGTGRFSGTVFRDEEDQAKAVAATQKELEAEIEASNAVQNLPASSALPTVHPSGSYLRSFPRLTREDAWAILDAEDEGMNGDDNVLDSDSNNATASQTQTQQDATQGSGSAVENNVNNHPADAVGGPGSGRAVQISANMPESEPLVDNDVSDYENAINVDLDIW